MYLYLKLVTISERWYSYLPLIFEILLLFALLFSGDTSNGVRGCEILPLFSNIVALAGDFNMVVFVGLTAVTILQLVIAIRNITLPNKIK